VPLLRWDFAGECLLEAVAAIVRVLAELERLFLLHVVEDFFKGLIVEGRLLVGVIHARHSQQVHAASHRQFGGWVPLRIAVWC